MIFKQVREIIEGSKTQTRRIRKSTEQDSLIDNAVYGNGRLKWQAGRRYAVVPGRGKPQVYYRYWQPNHLKDTDGAEGWIELHLAHEHPMPHFEPVRREITQLDFAKKRFGDDWEEYLVKCNYKPLYIEITDIRCEPLQDMRPDDAIAEGIKPRNESERYQYWHYKLDRWDCNNPIISYASLWESINGIGSWDKNPDVWVLTFKAVQA